MKIYNFFDYEHEQNNILHSVIPSYNNPNINIDVNGGTTFLPYEPDVNLRYYDGLDGNDIFYEGGYSFINGGDGTDKFYEDQRFHQDKPLFAQSKLGLTFYQGTDGGITILQDVEIISEQGYVDYNITDSGLVNSTTGQLAFTWANAAHGSFYGNSEIYASDYGSWGSDATSWLFSYGGNTIMHGSHTDDVFVSGASDDVIYSNGGSDTFLFSGDTFGNNTLYGFNQDDRIAIMGNNELVADSNYLDYLSETNNGLVFDVGDSSITLVGLSLDQVDASQFILA
jgi:hypothetical protein